MRIKLNTVLRQFGVDPSTVLLIRHTQSTRFSNPYDVWKAGGLPFNRFLENRGNQDRNKLTSRPIWVHFVKDPDGTTLFICVVKSSYLGHSIIDDPARYDLYQVTHLSDFSDLEGRLVIDWGGAPVIWMQNADKQDKDVVEVRKDVSEQPFPGFYEFSKALSELENIPHSWVEILKFSRGIYLLTCPRTREIYVGSATGDDGFWGRWQQYVTTGDGGNVGLLGREPSDFQVSILEQAGNLESINDILEKEARWKRRLLSKELGLNRN
jgi:hypothetical protein